MRKLTARGRALHRAKLTRGISEQPAGSNSDRRRDGIRAWQTLCAGGGTWLIGLPWCGVRCHNLLRTAGVRGLSARLASVAAIEDDARAHRGPFRGWTTDYRKVMRGDLGVLFGRGVHVALIRAVFPRLGIAITEEGNTTPPNGSGDQANGGCTARRVRPLSAFHGFALVDYPNR
jgi:hypothetical protein